MNSSSKFDKLLTLVCFEKVNTLNLKIRPYIYWLECFDVKKLSENAVCINYIIIRKAEQFELFIGLEKYSFDYRLLKHRVIN